MAGGAKVEQSGTPGEQTAAYIVVIIAAVVGGVLMQIFMYGMTFKSGKVGPMTFPRLLKSIEIPPLVGMIIFGCLARNFLPQEYMNNYPDVTAGYIRVICLSVILLRGGMELDFKGKGLTVVLMTLCPQMSEAIAVAIASRLIFGMPWALGIANGFTLAAVSPAVVVPGLMILQKMGYGVKKGIPTTLIAASSFDDIIAITAYGIAITVALNEAPGGIKAAPGCEAGANAANDPARLLAGTAPDCSQHTDSLGFEVLFIGAQIIAGLAVGLGVGFACKCFNYCAPRKTRCIKLLICLFMAISVPIVCEISEWYESKFICIIFFGYAVYQCWGEEKPEKELAIFWTFCQPFLFGSVGAGVIFTKINPQFLLLGIIIIVIGVSFRWMGTFCAGLEKKYNNKERAFMAFAWIPKATVQAALGGITQQKIKEREIADQKWIDWGDAMLTMAVFAICITAPLGAIFINTLGPKWLGWDDPEKKEETVELADQEGTAKVVPISATADNSVLKAEEAAKDEAGVN